MRPLPTTGSATASVSTSGKRPSSVKMRRAKSDQPSVGATVLNENMTLALRVAFETEGKLILFGDSYEVTPDGPKSLTIK